ncbi:MAG: hypothetical protein AAF423_06130 [Pseudomonadota bacterium]
MAGKIITTGGSILLIATGFALANEGRYDQSIADAAAKIAAGKVGELRGSIDYDEIPFMITNKLLKKEDEQANLLPEPTWVPPAKDSEFPPIVSNFLDEIDYTLTGSVDRNTANRSKRIVWEKFDRYGNPLD